MWTAWVVAAIALAGASFMVRFLIAMLREGAPSVSYWVVPVRRGPESEILEALSSDYVTENWRVGCGTDLCGAERGATTKLARIPVRPVRRTDFPSNRILVRMKVGPPRQS